MTDKGKPWLLHYDEGVPARIDIPKITLVDLFKEAVGKYGRSVCTIFGDEELTYQQIDDLSDRVAHFLKDRGLQKGERVGIFLPNTPAFVITYYAILKAGGVVMALNPAYRPAEVERLSSESGIKMLFLPEIVYETIKAIQDQTPIESLVVIGSEAAPLGPGDISWEMMLDRYPTKVEDQVVVNPEDAAIFQYSGGTTGTPKCAVGLHQNIVANVYQFNHWLVNTEQGKETILVAIPVYHVYGMVLGMNLAVKMGAKMVLISNPRDLDGLLHAIESHQATVFPGVPNIYAAINHYPPVIAGEYDLSSIKACISG